MPYLSALEMSHESFTVLSFQLAAIDMSLCAGIKLSLLDVFFTMTKVFHQILVTPSQL